MAMEERSPGIGMGDQITEIRSDMPPVDGITVEESVVAGKVSSRNIDHLDSSTMKPAIVEDPEEESKSDRGLL